MNLWSILVLSLILCGCDHGDVVLRNSEPLTGSASAGASDADALCEDHATPPAVDCATIYKMEDINKAFQFSCNDVLAVCENTAFCPLGFEPWFMRLTSPLPWPSNCVEADALACDQTAQVLCCASDGTAAIKECASTADCAGVGTTGECSEVECTLNRCRVSIQAGKTCAGGVCGWSGHCILQE